MYRIVKASDNSVKFGKYAKLKDAMNCLSVWNQDGDNFTLKIEV